MSRASGYVLAFGLGSLVAPIAGAVVAVLLHRRSVFG